MKRFLIVALASATALASYVPAQAFPLTGITQFRSSDIHEVRDHGGFHGNHRWRTNRHFSGRGWNRGYHGYGGYGGYWDGDDDAGALIGGLAAGAILGGILSSGARAHYRGNSHASYCYSRYKSYRASDNTFQPYNGPRQQCR